MADFSFSAHQRLKRKPDFDRARRAGRRKTGRCLVVWLYRRAETPAHAARLGLVVGRRHGIAARRNLFKRRVREVFRQSGAPAGWDFIVMPKTGGAFPPAYASVQKDFLEIVARTSVPPGKS